MSVEQPTRAARPGAHRYVPPRAGARALCAVCGWGASARHHRLGAAFASARAPLVRTIAPARPRAP